MSERKRDSTHNSTWYIQDWVKIKKRAYPSTEVLQLHADVEVIQCNRKRSQDAHIAGQYPHSRCSLRIQSPNWKIDDSGTKVGLNSHSVSPSTPTFFIENRTQHTTKNTANPLRLKASKTHGVLNRYTSLSFMPDVVRVLKNIRSTK